MTKKVPIQYKVISIILKVLIICGTTYYIFSRIRKQDYLDFSVLLQSILNSASGVLLVAVVVMLMLVNWSAETFKWQLLIRNTEKQSFGKAFSAVLSGVTFAVFTPNRIGEFGGRVLQMEEGDRVKGALASFTGSFAQLVITICLGSVALLIYLFNLVDKATGFTWPFFITLSILIVGVDALLLIFFLNSRLFMRLLRKTALFRKLKKYLVVFKAYTQPFLARILALSFFRYFTFIIQFYLLLMLFDVQIPFFHAIYLISLMYLLATIVPSFAVSEVTARGSVSVFLLSAVDDKPLQIAAAYFLLWVINIAVPALAGSVLVLNIHFFRNREKA